MAMKLEKSSYDFEILMGTFDGSLALIHGNPKNAEIISIQKNLSNILNFVASYNYLKSWEEFGARCW